MINSDSTINTFDHPLDYEIIKQGNKYKDPQFKNSKYSYIYCVIPKDKTFENIKYDILEKLYIPFGSGANDKMSKKLEKREDSNLEVLDEEILVSTGFKLKSKNAKVLGWYPKGRIRVSSGTTSPLSTTFVPVEGCLVRSIKALVVTHSALTNSNGDFYINESYWNISSVNYDIKWERAGFDIRSGAYGQAYFNGPHMQGDWNLDITSGGTYLNYLYAWAHKAAVTYYYRYNEFGIQPPPSVNNVSAIWGFVPRLLLSHRMHIGVSDSGGRSHYFDFNDNWLAAEIAVKVGTNASAVDIFATTAHELAHASHWSLGYNTADYAFNANFNRKLAESWAQAVGWFITARYYGLQPQNVATDIITNESQQTRSLSYIQNQASYYTPVFIDLIDNYNQPSNPNDHANNYTLSELEAILAQCPKNWYAYRDKLAEKTNNPTKTQAIWIFNNYK